MVLPHEPENNKKIKKVGRESYLKYRLNAHTQENRQQKFTTCGE